MVLHFWTAAKPLYHVPGPSVLSFLRVCNTYNVPLNIPCLVFCGQGKFWYYYMLSVMSFRFLYG